jgi:hypothetical protein
MPLFLSAGDALDMRTNKISHAFIQGRDISLETHQSVLNKRYKENTIKLVDSNLFLQIKQTIYFSVNCLFFL